MRLGCCVILMGALLGIGLGCAAPPKPEPVPQLLADSALLFDRYGGYPQASEMIYQSDWPSVDSTIPGPEQIYYRESIYDIQGLRGRGRDITYRRFRVERYGRAHR